MSTLSIASMPSTLFPRRHVVVIGAGAAGWAAAIAAAEAGVRVTLLERQTRPGAKLLVTGGGRCNLTNVLGAADMARRFGAAERFVRPALSGCDSAGVRRFFEALGVATEVVDGFHVFPVCNSAARVVEALRATAERLGVELRCGAEAVDWVLGDPPEHRVGGVRLADGSLLAADAAILCTGGPAWPSAGGTASGLELARRAGHALVPVVPALVPLVTREEWPRRCTGIVVEGARLRMATAHPGEVARPSRPCGAKGMEAGESSFGPHDLLSRSVPRKEKGKASNEHGLEARATSGALLFTHRGISGPAALDISGAVARRLAEGEPAVTLRACLTGEDRAEAWEERIRVWALEHGRRLARSLVAEHLPAAVAAEACAAAGVRDDDRAARLTREQRRALAQWLAAAPLTIAATEGMARAMVTAGGVARGEVAPRTMASRVAAGLYLAGEVLDVDGPCGGFNLTWAFASGRLAGREAASGVAAPLPRRPQP